MADAETPTRWPLRPVPAEFEWLRGPAWVDGEDIVLDAARASTYHPLAEPEIGMELARVMAPDDAVAFARRFGLLWRGRPHEGRPLQPLRESFSMFETSAEDLRYVLAAAELVRRGAAGDAEAIGRLHQQLLIPEDEEVELMEGGEVVRRRAGDVYSPDERFVDADDRTILMHANEYLVARPLNDMVAGNDACVYDRAFMNESVPPGALAVGIRPSVSLGAVCYLSVALALADRAPIGACADPSCARPFFITHRRQRFCSKACGNRVRFRRFADRRRTATTQEKEGD